MLRKNIPNPNSQAFREGFRDALEGWYNNIYSPNRDYTCYVDFKGGSDQAKREVKMYGLDYVKRYFRFKVCSIAIGKSDREAKRIIRLHNGSISRRELNAVLLYLDTLSEAYNRGVEDFLINNVICPYDETEKFIENLEWHIGNETAELAVKLHGRETVIEYINSKQLSDKSYHDFANGRYRQGFRNAVEGIDFNPFYLTTKPSEHLDFKAGFEQAKKEIKDYGVEYVRGYFRAAICSLAVGKPEDEVKEIIRLSDGSIPRHEYDAIFLYMNSTLEAFNVGVLDYIKGKPRVFNDEKMEISTYKDWSDGYRAAELAVKLHGRKAVLNQIILGRL